MLDDLRSKSLIVTGANVDARIAAVRPLTQAYRSAVGAKVYTLPEGLKDKDKLIRHARRIFPIVSPLGIPKEAMSYDQVTDVLFDWVPASGRTLIVVPETSHDADWMGLCVTALYVKNEHFRSPNALRFLFTTEGWNNESFDGLPLYFGRKEHDCRSTGDVARKLIKVVDLGARTGP